MKKQFLVKKISVGDSTLELRPLRSMTTSFQNTSFHPLVTSFHQIVTSLQFFQKIRKSQRVVFRRLVRQDGRSMLTLKERETFVFST